MNCFLYLSSWGLSMKRQLIFLVLLIPCPLASCDNGEFFPVEIDKTVNECPIITINSNDDSYESINNSFYANGNDKATVEYRNNKGDVMYITAAFTPEIKNKKNLEDYALINSLDKRYHLSVDYINNDYDLFCYTAYLNEDYNPIVKTDSQWKHHDDFVRALGKLYEKETIDNTFVLNELDVDTATYIALVVEFNSPTFGSVLNVFFDKTI